MHKKVSITVEIGEESFTLSKPEAWWGDNSNLHGREAQSALRVLAEEIRPVLEARYGK